MTDYIVVGGGSAGCVLANRLSADPAVQVVMLEAGEKDNSMLFSMPSGFFQLMKTGMGNWNYETVPQPGLNGRTMYFPRGKVLGGSSSINGMVVSRGNAGDYDHWAQMGNLGWSYEDCLPYFRRLESFTKGDATFRGHAGPIGVTERDQANMPPISQAWIDAGIAVGHPLDPDYNGPNPEGMGRMQGNYAQGVRQSASAKYIRPVLGRANLKVITGALAKSLVVKGGRCTGVEYIKNGHVHLIETSMEVILAGGAVNSPQLLQLSGIGDPADIRPNGIKMVLELPGVGKNLSDHLSVSVKQRITQPLSALSQLRPWPMVKTITRYLLTKSGSAATNQLAAWAHLKTRPDLEYPDVQIYCVEVMHNNHGREIIQNEGFMASVCGSRPASRGTIKIQSADPTCPPLIDPRYLSSPDDIRVLREGLKISRELIGQQAFDKMRGQEFAPGANVQSDEDLDIYVRSSANTIYHPVGTCKMGADEAAVVDGQLRVHGLAGLRVVDASIMPTIPSGNTNVPVMMIAEKAADLILGRTT